MNTIGYMADLESFSLHALLELATQLDIIHEGTLVDGDAEIHFEDLWFVLSAEDARQLLIILIQNYMRTDEGRMDMLGASLAGLGGRSDTAGEA